MLVTKNKIYILISIYIALFFSCKKENWQSKLAVNKVLLSNMSILKGYNLVTKDRYFAEAYRGSHNDSLYILKKGTKRIEITIEYFSNKKEVQIIESRFSHLINELYFENNSFKIRNKKINSKKSIGYIDYTLGAEMDLLHILYMERSTSKYNITIKTYNNKLSLNEIDFLYNELCRLD